jgi:hypothetical protein
MKTSYEILASGYFEYNQVEIEYVSEMPSSRYSAKEIKNINDCWTRRVNQDNSSNVTIYDSNIFRLDKIISDSNKISLLTSNVSYKEYYFYRNTNDREFYNFKPDPMGTSILLITADDSILFGKRSPKVEVNPGRYFTIGGFFDLSLDWDVLRNRPCIFKCMQRELKEEVDINIELSNLKMLGVVYDNITPHPEVSFLAHTERTNEDISNFFDKNEVKCVEFIDLDKIDNFVEQNRQDITESLLGAIEIFKNIHVN